jgi:hypothetical protein
VRTVAKKPFGNHTFLAYVEDHNEPGSRIDKLWIETRDRDGAVIADLSFERPIVPLLL